MRKEGVLLVLIVLCLPSVFALSVSLTSPATANTTNMTSIIFSCSASEPTYTISSISLYMNTTSSAWTQVATQNNASTSANFLISSLNPGAYIWNCFALNSNNENVSASSNSSLTISTLAFSGTIPNQTVTEDTNSSTLFDLDTYFTGASSYSFSGNSSFLFIVDSNNAITISPFGNKTGVETVTITAKSGSSSVTSNSFFVNITNVNDSPLKKANIGNITLNRDTNSTLDMDDYFLDPDSGTNLTYSLSASHFTLTQNESTVILTPEINWEGMVNATITASDGSASVSSNTFTITVEVSRTQENTVPTIDTYSPDTDPKLEVGETQEFIITSSDADEDNLEVSWFVNAIDQENTAEAFSFTATEEGSFTVMVAVSDGIEEATQSWTVTVGDSVVEVDSILSSSTTESSVCGNSVAEEGENCSSCALDVSCDEGYICNNGSCEQKKSAIKAILILLGVSILILILSAGIYYFTTLKKGAKKQESTTFQYTPVGTSPPADYTDFYKGKK